MCVCVCEWRTSTDDPSVCYRVRVIAVIEEVKIELNETERKEKKELAALGV